MSCCSKLLSIVSLQRNWSSSSFTVSCHSDILLTPPPNPIICTSCITSLLRLPPKPFPSCSHKLFPPPPPPPPLLLIPFHNRNGIGIPASSSFVGSSGDTSPSDNIIKQQEEKDKEAAREAVSELLQEHGVSKEESAHISLNSPNYVAMLIDGVAELDDLSLLMNSSSSATSTTLSFKHKVRHMTKLSKGDKGLLLPFLESLGLSLSSASHVARYLSSSHTLLPDLILKVKYMKEILFSDSNVGGGGRGGVLIGKNASRMMMHLSIPIDDDIQQTLSFFDKIRARRGGLDLLGSKDASFCCLIESFPQLLLLPVEFHMRPLVEFLQDIGVPRECIRSILLLFPPIIFYDIEKDIKSRMRVFEQFGTGKTDVGRMLVKYPWILSTSIQRNYEEILSFFDIEKVPKGSVDRSIKSWPHLLGCSISKLRLMVNQFGELGVKSKKLGQVIAKSPQLLLQKPQEFLRVVYFLKKLGLDEETVGRILGRCPEIFGTNIEKTLKKKLEFLTDIGVSEKYLPRVLRKYPELFVCDINKTLLPRMKYLMKSGLSHTDVSIMVRCFSPLLGYSIKEVLRPKLDFLVNTMEKPLRDVVDYPRYFSYSLEKKIKPRYWVLKGRNLECSLKDMLCKNDEEFAAEFMGVGTMLLFPPE